MEGRGGGGGGGGGVLIIFFLQAYLLCVRSVSRAWS